MKEHRIWIIQPHILNMLFTWQYCFSLHVWNAPKCVSAWLQWPIISLVSSGTWESCNIEKFTFLSFSHPFLCLCFSMPFRFLQDCARWREMPAVSNQQSHDQRRSHQLCLPKWILPHRLWPLRDALYKYVLYAFSQSTWKPNFKTVFSKLSVWTFNVFKVIIWQKRFFFFFH